MSIKAMTFECKGILPIKAGYNVAVNNDSAPEPITLEQRLEHVRQLLKNPEKDPQKLLTYLDRFTNVASLDGLTGYQKEAVISVANDILDTLEFLELDWINKKLRKMGCFASKNTEIIANNNRAPIFAAA
jgi:predicted amidohydrolase YtcJ